MLALDGLTLLSGNTDSMRKVVDWFIVPFCLFSKEANRLVFCSDALEVRLSMVDLGFKHFLRLDCGLPKNLTGCIVFCELVLGILSNLPS